MYQIREVGHGDLIAGNRSAAAICPALTRTGTAWNSRRRIDGKAGGNDTPRILCRILLDSYKSCLSAITVLGVGMPVFGSVKQLVFSPIWLAA